jgi:DNA-binding MarR family transcriptional regulator
MKNERDLEALRGQAWHDFMQMHEVLQSRLEQQLQCASNLSHADFAVLVVLSEAPERRLRVFEMGQQMGWEKSRLHHQLTRMCQRGLVVREPDPDSPRAIYAVLTDAGLAAITEAAPAHNQEVQRLFFDKISDEQVEQIGDISIRVLDGLLGRDSGYIVE